MAEGRPLPYPYTTGAQLMQFPYKFNFNNNWLYRSLPIGFLICIPTFYKFQVTSKSGGDKKKADAGHH